MLLAYIFVMVMPLQWGARVWQPDLITRGFRIDYLSGYVYPVDLAGLALAAALLVRSSYRQALFGRTYFRLGLVLFVWSTVQLWWVEQWLAHLAWALRILVFSVIAPYVSSAVLRHPATTVRIWLGQVLVVDTLAVFQLIRQASIGGLWYFLGERQFSAATPGIARQALAGGELVLRPYAFFSHPNTMAAYALMICSLVLFFRVFAHYKTERALLLLLASVAVLISFSQLSLIALSLLLLMWYLRRRSWGLKLNTYALIIAAFGVTISPLVLVLLGHGRTDIVARNDILLDFARNVTAKLLIGLGWFGSLVSSLNARSYNLIQPIHNALWQAVVSIGILPGLLLMYSYRTKVSRLLISCVPFFIITLLLAAFDHFLITQTQTLYLLMVCAALLSYDIGGSANPEHKNILY